MKTVILTCKVEGEWDCQMTAKEGKIITPRDIIRIRRAVTLSYRRYNKVIRRRKPVTGVTNV